MNRASFIAADHNLFICLKIIVAHASHEGGWVPWSSNKLACSLFALDTTAHKERKCQYNNDKVKLHMMQIPVFRYFGRLVAQFAKVCFLYLKVVVNESLEKWHLWDQVDRFQ